MSVLIPRNQFKGYKNNLKAVYSSSLIPYFDNCYFQPKNSDGLWMLIRDFRVTYPL